MISKGRHGFQGVHPPPRGPQRGQKEGKIGQNRCVVNSEEKQDASEAIQNPNLLVNIAWKYGLQEASTTL